MNWSRIKHFKEHEFVCSCGCGQCAMDFLFVAALDTVRSAAKVAFKISSGYRCAAHNAFVGGVSDSAHTKGLAADILTPSGAVRMAILRALLQSFDRVGVAHNFIHVDLDKEKPAPTMWVY